MLNLSKRGWNNVLIFASLAMILLFNGVHQKLMSNSEAVLNQQSILPEQSMILTLDLPGYSIERLGKGWRATHGAKQSVADLNAIVKIWGSIQGQGMSVEQVNIQNLPPQPDYVVTAWLAGEQHGYVLQLYTSASFLFIYDRHRDIWISISAEYVTDLGLKPYDKIRT